MTLVLTANVVLAVIVLTAISGLLAWPILTSRSQQTPAPIKSIGIRGPYARRYGRRPRTTTR